MGRLVSVNVGMPKNVPWRGKTVYTGIWKTPVEGPVMVRRINIDGDGQGDLAGHGGEQRAVMVYQTESYDFWKTYLNRDDLAPGHFGENFTVTGLADDEVCIGDRYRIGDAEFEVTQPRVTCFRVGLRLNEPEMPNLLVSQHRPGFYFRVITEGQVRAGDDIVRTRRGRHELSVADVDALLYLPDRDIEQLRKIVDVPALSPGWQQSFNDMLAAPTLSTAAAPPIGVEPGWNGFRSLRVSAVHRESDNVLSICLEADDHAPLPPPLSGSVPDRANPRCRRPDAAAQLLALRRSRRRRLPHQRQTRRARPGEPVAACAHQTGVGDRSRRTPWRLLSHRGRLCGCSDLRGNRRYAGAGHAARAVGRGQRPRHLVAAHHTKS